METAWKRDGNIVSGFSPNLTDFFIQDRPTPSKTVHDSSDQYSEALLEKLESESRLAVGPIRPGLRQPGDAPCKGTAVTDPASRACVPGRKVGGRISGISRAAELPRPCY